MNPLRRFVQQSRYHMPFPALGFVEARDGGGFRYVPASYQFVMDPAEG